jgi:hypothetical protein
MVIVKYVVFQQNLNQKKIEIKNIKNIKNIKIIKIQIKYKLKWMNILI